MARPTMESKKAAMYASLLEDDSDGPSIATSFGPVSPLRDAGSAPGLAETCSRQQQLSCVIRATSQEDCGRDRFIAWAAVKRNRNNRMSPAEKLECPTLRCTRRFPDHESMLNHLADCTYLARGEYWCYDHMRVERFDDAKCKRCLGHPSKRRKMLSMAKTFFHTLGHKSKKTSGLALDSDDTPFAPPPSYDSLGINSVNELPSTEIVEIDSNEVSFIQAPTLRPVLAADGAIDPQDLLVPMPVVPSIPELESMMPTNGSSMQWQPSTFYPSAPPTLNFTDEYGNRDGSVKPPLLSTYGLPPRRHAAPRPAPRATPAAPRCKGLSPSSSVRSTASTDSTDSTVSMDSNGSTESSGSTDSNGSSLVSPLSNWSGAWSQGSGANTSLTSPVEGFVMDPFADAIYESSCSGFPHSFYSELPADFPAVAPLTKGPDELVPDLFMSFPVMQPTPQPAELSYAELVSTDTHLMDVEINLPELEEASACCSDTKSVVGSAWDALQEHIVSSTLKIQHVQGNYLAEQLKLMSTRTVATAGLRTLRSLLNGNQPSSALDTLCFVHLMYAFSLVVHEAGTSRRADNFFLQSLSYANALPFADQQPYTQLALDIWQPTDVTQYQITQYLASTYQTSLSRSSSLKGKERATDVGSENHDVDALLNAARDFLDELEMSLVLGQIPSSPAVQTSLLYTKHLQDHGASASVNNDFAKSVACVLNLLAEEFNEAADLRRRLSRVCDQANNGTVTSVRRVEVELLSAGKDSLPSEQFFAQYTPRVRDLCNQIYELYDTGPSRRNAYHQAGIQLIEQLLPEFDNPTGTTPLIDERDDFDEFIDSLSATTTTTPPFSLDMTTSASPSLPTFTPAASSTSSSAATSPPAAKSDPVPPSPDAAAKDKVVESDACCDICGYRPRGDPQWFKGSMAKHRKLQHSTTPPVIYKCPFPGCVSQYKNRPDNLRQHQIEKNHWVEEDKGVTERRPSKRKKVGDD